MRIIILLLFSCVHLLAQDQGMPSIRKVLAQQQLDWNSGNLDAFMQGYWKSDSLKFISSRGINYGWQATLDGYKKGYPTTEAMGKLTFTIISIEKLSKKSAIVIGKWHLQRIKDEPQGHFTLLWKKIGGRWVIVTDHTS
jgi:ketosteroid isomerase-like protein